MPSEIPSALSGADKAKYVAARHSVKYVEDGMRVGLGTGSTAAWMVRCLGERVRNEGLSITAVPTSVATANLAAEMGIKVVTLEEAKWLDLTIDGADEFDDEMTLVKGGGGALLREKIVATASDRMVVIADAAKHVKTLGAFPLPVEVIPFGWQASRTLLEEALINLDVQGREVSVRLHDGVPFVTDEGNMIIDLHLKRIGNPRQISLMLNQIAGVVEHGLFVDICDVVVIGSEDGSVQVRDINDAVVQKQTGDILDSNNIFSAP
jgi:ribose 5-phosphate isomerase A